MTDVRCTCQAVKSDVEHAPDCAINVARAPKSVPGWEKNLKPPVILGYTLGPDYVAAGNPKPMPVYAPLTDEQRAYIMKRLDLEERITTLKADLEKAQVDLRGQRRECKHPIFNDEQSLYYDRRICTLCRQLIETI